MKNAVMKFIRDEKGLTAVEYGVAGCLILLGAIAAFTLLGTNLATVINAIAAALTVP